MEKILTKEGFKKLKSDLDNIKNVLLPECVNKISETRAQGDLSENSGYQSAKAEQDRLEILISELEHTLKYSKISSEEDKKTDKVGIGNNVKIKNNQSNVKITYELVGANEADPMNKKISYESPIGKGLVGKKVGEIAKVQTPSGEVSFEVLEIS